MKKSALYRIIMIPFMLPSTLALLATSSANFIWSDIVVWAEAIDEKKCETRKDKILAFYNYFILLPEFRSLFYYRVNWAKLFSFLMPSMPTLYITTPEIGPGLFIQHGFATIIAAKKIGANCRINQQVTIGYSNRTDAPTIGNGVSIAAGAIVIGNVFINDGSIVAANSVVVKDVEANSVVAGVPAKTIRRNGVKVEH